MGNTDLETVPVQTLLIGWIGLPPGKTLYKILFILPYKQKAGKFPGFLLVAINDSDSTSVTAFLQKSFSFWLSLFLLLFSLLMSFLWQFPLPFPLFFLQFSPLYR